MGRASCDTPLLPGSTLSVGGKDIEVDSLLSKEDYLAGRPFLNVKGAKPPNSVRKLPQPKAELVSKTAVLSEREEKKKILNVAAPKTIASQSQWKNPVLASTILPKTDSARPSPRHDPNTPGAIIMKQPTSLPKGKQVVDVVVDPILSKHLRDHQREGVKFMYECVMGMRDFNGQGAILADEMGLGKTLQTIALLWTLLKQNPIHEEAPVIKKALIVCPVTLINNWRKEIRKWLGNERVGVYVADNTKTRLTDFTMGKSYSIMIIGYEKLRTVQEELKKGSGIDIVIADEGHRLKTAQNKSAQAIKSLNTLRRVILSGTPIQNDLSEFFMMVDFVNPGLLGSFKTFTKEFEVPIVKSRQPNAFQKDVEKGEARNDELAALTAMFILRRTADILSKYLPPKTEYVLLCRPTAAQVSVYHHVLASPVFQSALGSSENALQLITILKKVCNSPSLLDAKVKRDAEKLTNPLTASLLSTLPLQFLPTNNSSAKIRVLDQLLFTIRTTTDEKVVLVSNFTSTLDLLQTVLGSLSLPFLRLDGSTPSSKRQDLVDAFNRTPPSANFAFLLSAKSGGVGLNLIGASRLVLFDVDWNPATDLQAMARIHRDGQKRPCFIYRLLVAGSLDEKIWQRQVTKLGLASSVMDQRSDTSSFTKEELKDLFRLDEGLSCQTHDLIGCNCGGKGMAETTAADMPVEIFGDGSGADEEFPDMRTVMEDSAKGSNTDEAASKNARHENVMHSEELSNENVSIGTLVKASRVNMEKQEQQIKDQAAAARKERGNLKMQSLMAYSHIDTSKFQNEVDEDMEALIKDDILLDVLRDEGNRVSFVFAKTSG